MQLCDFGCKQESTHQLKNGKWCCAEHWNKCPAIRKKNAEGVSKAHEDGRCLSEHLTNEKRVDWSKGKTILDDPRLSRKTKPEEIFCQNSKTGTSYVKKILQMQPDYKHQCSMCKNTEWLGIPIALELDHVNGDHYDNRLDNLRFICPNCHATTHTWKGRNKKGINKKVTDEELIEALNTTPNIRQALMKAGLSGMGKNYTRAYELKTKLDIKQTTDILSSVENNIPVETQVVDKSKT
jgi:hypothetical protein